MSGWRDFEAELTALHRAGRAVDFWWRDDDAAKITPALHRLTDLAASLGAPLALAVIPATLDPGLAAHLDAAAASTRVLQHGFAHRNHAPALEKKAELGPHRAIEAIGAEVRQGHETLAKAFDRRFLPIMVPPWNRVAETVVDALSDWGYTGLSTYGPCLAPRPRPGLVQVNSHLDLMAWKPQRRFLGGEALCATLTASVRARRAGGCNADEPIGILSHHLVHDGACWEFLEALLRRLTDHPGARLLTPDAVFTA